MEWVCIQKAGTCIRCKQPKEGPRTIVCRHLWNTVTYWGHKAEKLTGLRSLKERKMLTPGCSSSQNNTNQHFTENLISEVKSVSQIASRCICTFQVSQFQSKRFKGKTDTGLQLQDSQESAVCVSCLGALLCACSEGWRESLPLDCPGLLHFHSGPITNGKHSVKGHW